MSFVLNNRQLFHPPRKPFKAGEHTPNNAFDGDGKVIGDLNRLNGGPKSCRRFILLDLENMLGSRRSANLAGSLLLASSCRFVGLAPRLSFKYLSDLKKHRCRWQGPSSRALWL